MTNNAHPSAEYWIKHLQLQPHPEGGFYQAVTRGNYTVPNQKGLARFAYTTIYFLLTPDSPSHLHRLCSDETWLYHAGDPLQVHVLLEHLEDELSILRPGAPRAVAHGRISSENGDDISASSPESDAIDVHAKVHPNGPLEQPEDYPLHTPFHPRHVPHTPKTNAPTQEDMSTPDVYQCYRRVPVGPRVHQGEVLQYTVPANAIFGSSVVPGGAAGYSLVSCVVSPGFDFRDFELFTQAQLMELCPQHETVIRDMAYETIPQ